MQHTAAEKLGDDIIRATLITKRNDPCLNSHSRLLLQHWRANVDLQVVVDVHACAHYMAKYVAKGEPHSKTVSVPVSKHFLKMETPDQPYAVQ